MTATTKTIPANFGTGGSGLTPNKSAGTPSLKEILDDLKTAIDGTHAANIADTSIQSRRNADVAAGDVLAESVIHQAKTTHVVSAVRIVPSGNVVTDETNNVTITLRRRNADGTGAVTVAAYTSNAAGGALTAWISKTLAGLANTALAAGQLLTMQVTKAGTGVALPGLLVVVDFSS